ncbi:MAG: PspC domain-containing protein, partial [Oscillospiraceae bacterium]
MDKKLYKSRNQKMVCGICGGVAEYFNIDTTLVRLIWAAFCICGGAGIIA